MASVFHYTDSAELLGILSSKSLFATDYRYLNDISEGSMIRGPIVEIFEAEIAALAPKLHEHGLLESLNAPHRQLAEGFYQSIVNALDAATPIFVLSFCHHTNEKHIQHGLLSQWRGYAGSAGFAIEFDEIKLCELVGVEMNTFAHVLMKSDSVHYENYKEKVDPDYYRGVASELIRRRFHQYDVSHITGRVGPNQMDIMMINFGMTRPYLKHDGFQEEQEYRIVAARVGEDKILADATRREKEVKFRSRDGLIVPYIELFKDSPSPLPIKSIIVGPHPTQEKQEAAVKAALEPTPFSKAEVRLSGIPFRK